MSNTVDGRMTKQSSKEHAARSVERDGERLVFRVMSSETARKMRLRVNLSGVEVLRPAGRALADLDAFVVGNIDWARGQIARIERLRRVRMPSSDQAAGILLGGEWTPLVVEARPRRAGTNKVMREPEGIRIVRGVRSNTTPAKSLEYWLRRRAREAIVALLPELYQRVDVSANRVLVMGQRTKWGNCSRLGNLSFNWRLVMAPDYVIRYLVTHEVVHLKVPDHSIRFWLTVRSLCPDTERARQWLCANVDQVFVDLEAVIGATAEPG